MSRRSPTLVHALSEAILVSLTARPGQTRSELSEFLGESPKGIDVPRHPAGSVGAGPKYQGWSRGEILAVFPSVATRRYDRGMAMKKKDNRLLLHFVGGDHSGLVWSQKFTTDGALASDPEVAVASLSSREDQKTT